MKTKQPMKGRSRGGQAKNAKMTPEQRKELSMKMVAAKKDKATLPRATHGSAEHPLRIGDVELPCYVLEDGTRVLSQRGLITGLGMGSGADRLPNFFRGKAISPFVNNELMGAIQNPIKFIAPHGGVPINGYPATILADICEAVLAARSAGVLQFQQTHIAEQCEILVRGFARVGIIALVDEATGYQKDRAKDALAKILEAYVAKELQPYLKTFPAEYYEQLFRLYGYKFPPENKRPQWRPIFFGKITNEVIYNRLAPAVLPELKKAASRAEKKAKLFQWLTGDIGHPKLREHLASIVSILKLSKTPEDFRRNVDIVHPRFNQTIPIDFTYPDDDSRDSELVVSEMSRC